MKKHIIIIGILVLVSSNFVFGQFADWTNYVNPELITDRVETSSRIWFSSKDGVIELDKSTLQITKHNRSNAAIPSNEVEGIAVDGNGFIWIGTYEQAIGKFDGTSWETIPYPNNLFGTTNTVETYCIEVDNQDVVWIGTSEGLVRYDGTNWQIYNIQNGTPNLKDVWAMELDNQGDLYISSFFAFKYDGMTFQQITDASNFTVYGTANFTESSNGDIWLSGFSGVLGKYDGTSWTEYTAQNGAIPQQGILNMEEGLNGEMMVNFYNDGKYVLQNGVWNPVSVSNYSEIDSSNITTNFYDNQGNEWIGSHDILIKNDGQNVTVKDLKAHTINHNRMIRDVSVDANGNIYVVNGPEIAMFDGTNWSNLALPMDLQNSFFPSLDRVLFTTNGNAYLSSGWGFHHWDGTNWTLYSEQNSDLPTDNSYEWIFDENTQTLWIGTTLGLVEFDGTTFTTYDPSNTILTNPNISRFNLDNNGLMYVAINQNDLFTFDGTNWQDVSATSSPSSIVITTLHFDNNNTLWVGSRNDGLFKLENGNWEIFDMSNSNLPNNEIHQIVSNANGKLFIATDGGLATLEGNITEAFTTQNSGVSDDIVREIAFDYSDNLWLGTDHGVSVLQLNMTDTKPVIIQNNSLKVFPNPINTTATVTFDLKKATDNIHVKIINVEGKIIQEILIDGRANIGQQQLEISRNQLGNGLYYLSIQTDKEQLVKPILIQD